MRKKIEAGLRAKVALEAFRGEKTVAQIAAEYQVHPNQVSKWKQELIAGSAEIFSNGKTLKDTGHQEQIDKLHRVIGEITVERDWLKKKLNLLI
jgi:transposase-like protein